MSKKIYKRFNDAKSLGNKGESKEVGRASKREGLALECPGEERESG